MENRSVSDPEEAHYNRMRVAKILGVAAAVCLACCLGVFFGGALVYGVTSLGGPAPAAEAPPEIIVEKEIEIEKLIGAPGATLVEVLPDSPAEEAGLLAGDQILAVDGEVISQDQDLGDFIARYEPGDKAKLTVVRPDEGRIKVRVRLGQHPEKEGTAYLGVMYTSQALPGPGSGLMPFEGHEDFDPSMPFFGVPGFEAVPGAIVHSVVENSPAAAAGLSEGDVITALDGQPVEGAEALVERVGEYEVGDRIVLTVTQVGGGKEREVLLVLGQHPDDPDRAFLGISIGDHFPMPSFEGGEAPEGFHRFHGQPFHFGIPEGHIPFDSDEWPIDPGHFHFDWDEMPFDWHELEPDYEPGGDSA